MIKWWNTNFGYDEVNATSKAILNKKIGQGDIVNKLENEIAKIVDCKYGVACNSGSSALLMALMSSNITKSDEVIIPNRTWIATAHAVCLAGAKPIIVDVQKHIPIASSEEILKNISPKTKAIINVHLNGRYAYTDKLLKFCKAKGIIIIEDACQALLSQNNKIKIGSEGDIGCYSFGMTKLISGGGGGIAVTNNKKLFQKMRMIRNHGVEDQFTESWNCVGFNFKYSDVLASIALTQLDRRTEIIENVLKTYDHYKSTLSKSNNINLLEIDTKAGNIPLYIEIETENRDNLVKYLYDKKIQVRVVPPNISSSEYLISKSKYPNSKYFQDKSIYVPCGPDQSIENLNLVSEALLNYGK